MDINREYLQDISKIIIRDIIEAQEFPIIEYTTLGYLLERKLGLQLENSDLEEIIKEMTVACIQEGLPLISAIVLKDGEITPSETFFEMYYQTRITSNNDRVAIWLKEIENIQREECWHKLISYFEDVKAV